MEKPEGHSILIVDDNPNNLFSLHELIRENFEVEVIEAVSGFEALRVVNERRVDLCLMDVQMPDMDGFETAKLIKSRPKTARIPIFFITAFDPSKSFMDKGLESGGLDYLSKPIDDVQIVHLLHMYLRFIDRERNLNIELEEKVQARTLELQQANRLLKLEIEERKRVEKDLKDYQTMLQNANACKDKFFSIIAHDLRNPFNALIGLSDLLIEGLPGFSQKEVEEFVQLIHDSSQNAFELLNNLLDWSRSQTSQMEFLPGPLVLVELVDESRALLAAQASKKGVKLVQEVDSELKVLADRNMCQVVLRNLMANSIKFSHADAVTHISARRVGQLVEVCVEDQGVGMPPEAVAHLFRIDKKVQTQGTAEETGTGLGLILCREFVEKNGGSIWVESQVGKGSRFFFTLPCP
jgi:two-component system sensor histidine kinase/response regulator